MREQAAVYATDLVGAMWDLMAAFAHRVTEDRVTAARTFAREFNIRDLVGVAEDHERG